MQNRPFSTPAGQGLPDKAAFPALSTLEFYIVSGTQNRAPATCAQVQRQAQEITEQVIQPLTRLNKLILFRGRGSQTSKRPARLLTYR